jgi:large subunit ribosomal protein L30
MIITIRISGLVGVPRNAREALFRMRLRRKYSAVLLKPSTENLKLLKKLRNHIAYGDIDKETLTKLIEKRGQSIDKSKKIDAKKVIEGLEKKGLKDLGLHPPRGGIEAKTHFPIRKGVLGDNKRKINDLVRRML